MAVGQAELGWPGLGGTAGGGAALVEAALVEGGALHPEPVSGRTSLPPSR